MLGPWVTAPESTAEAGSRQHRQDKTERVTLDRRRMLKYADLIDKKQSVKFFGSSLKMKKNEPLCVDISTRKKTGFAEHAQQHGNSAALNKTKLEFQCFIRSWEIGRHQQTVCNLQKFSIYKTVDMEQVENDPTSR